MSGNNLFLLAEPDTSLAETSCRRQAKQDDDEATSSRGGKEGRKRMSEGSKEIGGGGE